MVVHPGEKMVWVSVIERLVHHYDHVVLDDVKKQQHCPPPSPALHGTLHPVLYRLLRIYERIDAIQFYHDRYKEAVDQKKCFAGRPEDKLTATDKQAIGGDVTPNLHSQVWNE